MRRRRQLNDDGGDTAQNPPRNTLRQRKISLIRDDSLGFSET